MQQHDEVVSGWLNGSDSVDGEYNPAGPLYIEANTESALTNANNATGMITSRTTVSCGPGRPGACNCC